MLLSAPVTAKIVENYKSVALHNFGKVKSCSKIDFL